MNAACPEIGDLFAESEHKCHFIQDSGNQDSCCVPNQIYNKKAFAQEQCSEQCITNRLDPVFLIQLTEFNAEAEQKTSHKAVYRLLRTSNKRNPK